jgi:uncharacterized metal-binding protein
VATFFSLLVELASQRLNQTICIVSVGKGVAMHHSKTGKEKPVSA